MNRLDQPLDTLGRVIPVSELVDDYDGLICDKWGVINNGAAEVDGAVDARANPDLGFKCSRRSVIWQDCSLRFTHG
jgi:hypothetical protein